MTVFGIKLDNNWTTLDQFIQEFYRRGDTIRALKEVIEDYKQQIEKMKNCWNCKYSIKQFDISLQRFELICKHKEYLTLCDKWELKE